MNISNQIFIKAKHIKGSLICLVLFALLIGCSTLNKLSDTPPYRASNGFIKDKENNIAFTYHLGFVKDDKGNLVYTYHVGVVRGTEGNIKYRYARGFVKDGEGNVVCTYPYKR